MFCNIYFLIYLIYQGRRPWYILVNLSRRKNRIGLVSLGCFNVINPPFVSHAKNGIDNVPLDPFTLLLVEVPVRSNDQESIVLQICFFGWVLRKNIKWNIVIRRIWLRWIWGPPSQKIGKHFLPKSQNGGPRIHCGKNHGRIQ